MRFIDFNYFNHLNCLLSGGQIFPAFVSQLLAFFPFVSNNLGHSFKTLAGFSIGLIKNNGKHERDESLLGRFLRTLPASPLISRRSITGK